MYSWVTCLEYSLGGMVGFSASRLSYFGSVSHVTVVLIMILDTVQCVWHQETVRVTEDQRRSHSASLETREVLRKTRDSVMAHWDKWRSGESRGSRTWPSLLMDWFRPAVTEKSWELVSTNLCNNYRARLLEKWSKKENNKRKGVLTAACFCQAGH